MKASRDHSGLAYGLVVVFSRLIVAGSDDSSDFQKSLPALLVWGIPGQDAELPCDVTANKNDQVSMVLWFKDSTGIPVYSLDARGEPLEHAIHWAMSNDFGSRSNFIVSKGSGPSRLKISKVIASDQGIYRCRIDFNNSPTRNYKVNFTLIVPPSEPIIYDGQGREVIGVAGPFMEGYDLFLSCHVVGGRPRPKVTWWRDDQMVDDEMESVGPSLAVNQYFRPNVSRALYNAKLKCKVSVTETAPALVKEVLIEVYLKPRWVKMNVISTLLSSGRPQQYQCDTWGSVPPAKITWLLEGEPIRNAAVSLTQETNLTTSVLTYKPLPEDDGRELTCRAENPRYLGSILEESMELTVLYPPMVSIKIGPGIDPQMLREGDEVRFFCSVNANPKSTHISWFLGDTFVHNSPHSGVLASDKSLEIRHLTGAHAGEYSCGARNIEGEGRSDSISIRVLYPPRCKDEFKSRTMGALKRDTIRIRCEVNADPSKDIKFSWTFNTSGDVLPLPATRIVSSELSSYIDFTPISDSDFGTLACWAVNGIGRQAEPCLTHIYPAKIPQPPKDCRLKNETTGGLHVTCAAGHDGGLQQHFMLEVMEYESHLTGNSIDKTDFHGEEIPKYKVLGSEPDFVLRGLETGLLYTLSVYAINAKGRSEPPVVIPGVRFRSSTARLTSTESMKGQEEEESQNPMVIILGALIGVALLIIMGITIAGLVLCKKESSPEDNYTDVFSSSTSAKKLGRKPFQVPILRDNMKSKKVNNSTRKNIHEIRPLDELNSLKPFMANGGTDETVQTAVIRKNGGSAARQIRNSLSLSIGNPADLMPECRPIPVEMKPFNLNNPKNSILVPEESSEANVLTNREEIVKKGHARVTLNAEGEVLKCVIEGSEEQTEETT